MLVEGEQIIGRWRVERKISRQYSAPPVE